jgi:hypothetical protein
MAVQTLHGPIGFFIVINFDKPESAWLPGKTVAHQRNGWRRGSRLRK